MDTKELLLEFSGITGVAGAELEAAEYAAKLLSRFGETRISPLGSVICEVCPPKVIAWEQGGWPRIDRDRCIRCYCCHELCPHQAMKLRAPGFLGRWLRLGR